MIDIADPTDPRLADFTQLTDVALRRKLDIERGLYLAEGAKVIQRALAAGHELRAVLTSQRWSESLPPIGADVPVYLLPDDVMDQLTGFHIHRGALASFHRPVLPDLADLLVDARRIFVLENLVDHTNVGAAFRSAAALGVDAVVVTDSCADPLYRRSIKVSMGTVFQVPWTRVTGWPQQLAELRAAGWISAALALDPAAIDLATFAKEHAAQKIALVLGSEGDGLAARTIAQADVTVTIPMQGGVDSLNVSAAAAVAAWELRRRV